MKHFKLMVPGGVTTGATLAITAPFDFKQIASESTLTSISEEIDEQQDRVTQFEVSSEVVLRPGQPRIVGATKKDEAIFLIMEVDI